MSTSRRALRDDVRLLERSDQLSALAASLDAVTVEGTGAVVLVGGEAGVGKTALLRRSATAGVARRGSLWGACDATVHPAPARAAVRRRGGDRRRARGARGQRAPGRTRSRRRSLDASCGRGAPTVLVLEDLHWADEATLDVLRLLARTVAGGSGARASPPTATTSSTAPTRCARRSASCDAARGRRASRSQPLSADAVGGARRAARRRRDELLPRRPAATRSSSPRCSRPATSEIPPHRARRGARARRAPRAAGAERCSRRSRSSPPQAELWLLEALAAGDARRASRSAWPRACSPREPDGVAFRHELARLAIEEALAPAPPGRAAPGGARGARRAARRRADLARLAHHAEAAGDAAAVLRFAPAAAERAASLGAHREAAAQYARALRFADGLPPGAAGRAARARARTSAT